MNAITTLDAAPSAPPQGVVPGPLTTCTMRSLSAYFASKNHRPSPAHMNALATVAATMEAMADGACPAMVHLAAIDCGVGKSQTAIHFARALTGSPHHQGIGMIICVNRLSQIKDLLDALITSGCRVAALTSDEMLNQRSTVPVDEAQVLLVTQQRVERLGSGGLRFGDIWSLFYFGRPREVRVWDEAFAFGVPVTLGWHSILSLSTAAMNRSPAFANALADFGYAIKGLKGGERVDVPDFEVDHGISLHELLADCATGKGVNRDQVRDDISNLMALNGRIARAFFDNHKGAVTLTYQENIPDDLKPVLVLDASARVRQTYRDMELFRGGVLRLPEAVKDYSNLEVFMWQTSGSKTGFAARGEQLVKGVADTILLKPAERWLVITHKPGAKVGDVAKAIERRLPADVCKNVAFLTYGQHLATNDHADVENLILAGQLFPPRAYVASLTHLSQGRPVEGGLVSSEEITATLRGELADTVLQAVARGRCRKCDGDKAQPMTAYIIASPQSGVPAALPRIFPNCVVRPWAPFRKQLRGHIKLAVEYVQAAIDVGRTEVGYKEIYEALGLTQSNFSARVTKDPDWKTAIPEMGCGIGRGKRGALLVVVIG